MDIRWIENRPHQYACYDLYVNGEYMHAWVQDAHLSWHAVSFTYGENNPGQHILGSYPTKQEAKDRLIALLVERRLDAAR